MYKCTCIIPVYNEGSRILRVLNEVARIKSIDEIICVNDSSTDNTLELIKKYHFNIKVVTTPKNLGKTGAIKEGLQVSTGDYILLLDGDLRNLQHQEVENAVTNILKDPAVDMIILRRINAPWNIKILRGDILVSGERLLRKEDLKNILKNLKPEKYQLEFATNKYMMMNNKKVYWMPSSALNTWPTTKFGFAIGMNKIISMNQNILAYLGFVNYLKQLLFFCRQKLT
ncbi:MAG: glycosyltransferase family 2 protein [Patescibacteria group bacterium]